VLGAYRDGRESEQGSRLHVLDDIDDVGHGWAGVVIASEDYMTGDQGRVHCGATRTYTSCAQLDGLGSCRPGLASQSTRCVSVPPPSTGLAE